MTISYIDKTKRRQTCVCLLLSGWPKRPVAKSFHPFAKIQQFFFPASLFLKKKAGNSFFPAFSPRVCTTTTHPFSLILTEKKLRQLLPVSRCEYSFHIFLARQHRLQQLAQRKYRAIAHKFLVYRSHCIDYIVHQRVRLECRILCFHLNYELSILCP